MSERAHSFDFDGMKLAPALTRVWGALPEPLTIHKLLGEASTRSYYRVHSERAQPSSLIVMRLPAGGTPRELGLEELPFTNVQRYLAALGVRVPRLYCDASDDGLLLLEDLGDETLEARLREQPESKRASYERAVELLAGMHDASERSRDCVAFQRVFSEPMFRWELSHFRDWGLSALNFTLSTNETALLEHTFADLTRALLALPTGFAHFDYQSRNLIFAPSGELAVLDFQDALMAPLGYDLVALLCDSYVELDEALQEHLVAHYAQLRGLDQSMLREAFLLVCVQRKLKDAGRFVFLDQVRGKPQFLAWYARSLAYVARALRGLPRYQALAALLADKLPGYPDAIAAPTPRTASRSLAPGEIATSLSLLSDPSSAGGSLPGRRLGL